IRLPPGAAGRHCGVCPFRYSKRPTGRHVGVMKFLGLYFRVLRSLGPEARLGWILALAGVALAIATFVEPILFGKIVDSLANAQPQGANRQLDWSALALLVGGWVGFGLFTIIA